MSCPTGRCSKGARCLDCIEREGSTTRELKVFTRERFLAGAELLDGGIARCKECKEVMLEDERHWHWRKVV